MNLRSRLSSLKHDGVEKSQNHFGRFDGVLAELKRAGGRIEEMDAVNHLLLLLPSQYDTQKHILASSIEEITLESVKNSLLSFEEIIKSSTTSAATENKISMATQPVNKIKCYNCGILGHKAVNC